MGKYEVTIKNSKGACENELFKKLATKGDIVADRVTTMINKVVTIRGYAECHVKTDDKEFDINYFATDNGYISSGSEYFLDSVKSYIDFADTFKINEIKTKKGKTYKAMPVMSEKKPESLEATNDDLPF